jgi:hypothetical protein
MKGNTNEVRAHHFVPQCWLAGFTNTGEKEGDALLLPDYRSVNVDGSSNDKAAILALARKNASSTKRATADEEWRVTHPYLMSVKIIGDTAVLTVTLNKSDSPRRIMSCDIFVYCEGHWRALYSQHSTAAA